MQKIILLTFLLSTMACSHTPYVKTGIAYKIKETDITWVRDNGTTTKKSDPVTARIDLGLEYEAFTYGISHHSQYFTGAPFNNDPEYSKTELFLDYTYRFK